jgi:hypothetical protein
MEKLLHLLSQIVDVRRKAGRRHKLEVILFVNILATIQGARSRRDIDRFVKNNLISLQTWLPTKSGKYASGSTTYKELKRLNPNELEKVLRVLESEETVSDEVLLLGGDGKSMKGTVVDGQGSGQNFVSICSFFDVLRKRTVAVQAYQNGHESEMTVFQEMLLKSNFMNAIVMGDALHGQKKL